MSRTADMKKEINSGCLERNVAVDALPEDQQTKYCGCYSDKLAAQLQWHVTKAAITFRTAGNPMDDPKFVSMATQASEECGAALGS